MKVIGKVNHETYLCEVKHKELEKFLNQYYGKMKELGVGKEIDLGLGYDWAAETKKALNSTQQFFKDNSATIKAITRAFLIENGKG